MAEAGASLLSPPLSYDFRSIETKWQARWEAQDAHHAETHPAGPTCFVLVFPPYPNGRIHMGHVRNYTIGDAVARYKRLRGISVLHPIGFDAFGLPNEIEAAKQGIDPERLTRDNILTMMRQLRRLGYSYDFEKMIVTIEPQYYMWNQWLFLALRQQGLAYRKAARVQWCPSCRTSLANEQVADGRCWRCDTPIVARFLLQWFFRLRAYAEEIWSEAGRGAFPDNIARMIRQWIGRSEGAELRFPVQGSGDVISVFTTRPELACGATYLAVSPDHPLAEGLVAGRGLAGDLCRLRERARECAEPAGLTDGLETGKRALHPLTGESIPIWVAAYVDPDFATGAAMGNPCHDLSDHEFGRAHGLAGKVVVSPEGSAWSHAERGPYLGDGLLTGCGPLSGRSAVQARADVIGDWEARGAGARSTVHAIRDWLISRQRAWGTPIPVVHCADCGEVSVHRRDLPVRLPGDLRDPGGGNPLARRPDFLACKCPACRRPAQRETDTMDTFIDTAWYYLRCTNPGYEESLCDPEAVARWGPADLYVGGIEIAVPIMLYGSFITKALRDGGHLGFSLPCRELLAHEMVLNRGRKMSKSLGNTVDPVDLVERVGADSVRLLILSLAPPLKKIEWSESRLLGCHRILGRVWALGLRQAGRASDRRDLEASPLTDAERRLVWETHEVVRAVTQDMERLQPNTCITALIKFLYALEGHENEPCEDGGIVAERRAFSEALRTLLILLSPFAPHLCEELWERMRMPSALGASGWPRHDPESRSRGTSRIAVKVDAKRVVWLEVPVNASREEVVATARENEAVQRHLCGRTVGKAIYVPGQVLNIVTS